MMTHLNIGIGFEAGNTSGMRTVPLWLPEASTLTRLVIETQIADDFDHGPMWSKILDMPFDSARAYSRMVNPDDYARGVADGQRRERRQLRKKLGL